VLLNNAQAVYPGGPPQSVTAPVTVVFPINVQVSVYNSAGELVKTLLIQSFAQVLQTFQLSSLTLTGQTNSIGVSLMGNLATSWDGTSQNGTPVTNGQYFIKVQSTDSMGVVTSVTQTVTVNRSLSMVSVAVYNEAGEVVKHLYQALVPVGDNTIQSVSLSSSVISPGGPSASPGAPAQTNILVAMSSGGMTIVWDGTGDAGNVVTNGQYFVEAHWVNESGGDQTITQKVSVLNSGRGMVQGQVFAQPNLLAGGQTTTLLKVNSASSLTLTARFYTVSGELVGTAQGLEGTNQVAWNAMGVASGFYLAVVELQDSEGMVARQIIHLVVRR
jgi:flagellar hook assembly protein FlgD